MNTKEITEILAKIIEEHVVEAAAETSVEFSEVEAPLILDLADHVSAGLCEKLSDAVEAGLACPAGLVEVRGSIDSLAAPGDRQKPLKATVHLLNTESNRIALARMEQGVTMRGIQLHLDEKAPEDNPADDEDPLADEFDDDPNQLDLEDATTAEDGSEPEGGQEDAETPEDGVTDDEDPSSVEKSDDPEANLAADFADSLS